VADVGAEQGVEARAHRIAPPVECPGVDRIVGLAPEVEARDEEVLDVLLARDPAAVVVVEVLDAADLEVTSLAQYGEPDSRSASSPCAMTARPG
jgi:hypothetical protein